MLKSSYLKFIVWVQSTRPKNIRVGFFLVAENNCFCSGRRKLYFAGTSFEAVSSLGIIWNSILTFIFISPKPTPRDSHLAQFGVYHLPDKQTPRVFHLPFKLWHPLFRKYNQKNKGKCKLPSPISFRSLLLLKLQGIYPLKLANKNGWYVSKSPGCSLKFSWWFKNTNSVLAYRQIYHQCHTRVSVRCT